MILNVFLHVIELFFLFFEISNSKLMNLSYGSPCAKGTLYKELFITIYSRKDLK